MTNDDIKSLRRAIRKDIRNTPKNELANVERVLIRAFVFSSRYEPRWKDEAQRELQRYFRDIDVSPREYEDKADIHPEMFR